MNYKLKRIKAEAVCSRARSSALYKDGGSGQTREKSQIPGLGSDEINFQKSFIRSLHPPL
jgi:hypothetical protein